MLAVPSEWPAKVDIGPRRSKGGIIRQRTITGQAGFRLPDASAIRGTRIVYLVIPISMIPPYDVYVGIRDRYGGENGRVRMTAQTGIRLPTSSSIRGAFVVNLPITIPRVEPDQMNVGSPSCYCGTVGTKGIESCEANIRPPSDTPVRGSFVVDFTAAFTGVIPGDVDEGINNRHRGISRKG